LSPISTNCAEGDVVFVGFALPHPNMVTLASDMIQFFEHLLS